MTMMIRHKIYHVDRLYMESLAAPLGKRKSPNRFQRFLAQSSEKVTLPPYVIELPAANAIITHHLMPYKVSNELRRFLEIPITGGIHEFLDAVIEYARDPGNGGFAGCEGMAIQTKSPLVSEWNKPPANRQAVFYMPLNSTERIIIEWYTAQLHEDGKALRAQPYTGPATAVRTFQKVDENYGPPQWGQTSTQTTLVDGNYHINSDYKPLSETAQRKWRARRKILDQMHQLGQHDRRTA